MIQHWKFFFNSETNYLFISSIDIWGKVETVAEFIFLGSKITADGDYSHEIKRCLLLGRKVMTNIRSSTQEKA